MRWDDVKHDEHDHDQTAQSLPADWRDFLALTKPRVMTLVVFTGLCGLLVAPAPIHPVLGFTAILCIALGAGAAAALNMWYEADLDALMKRTASRPLPAGRMDRRVGAPFRRRPRLLLGAADGAGDQLVRRRDPRRLDPVLRLRLHDLAEAADAAEHRHRRRRRRLPAADRLGGGDRRRRRLAAAAVRARSSCGRRRISGRCRCSSAPITPPPACRCCRWSPAPRRRASRSCSTRCRWRRRRSRPGRSASPARSTASPRPR